LAKRPMYSRWKRLPGLYRTGDEHLPDPHAEPLRLTLYLPGTLIDWAEEQARRAGAGSVQEYCTSLLRRAIEAAHDRRKVEESEARRATLEGLAAISADPEYLAELSAEMQPTATTAEPFAPIRLIEDPANSAEMRPMRFILSPAALAIRRHAGLDEVEDPMAFLPSLRRGEAVPLSSVTELETAMAELEVQLRDSPSIDRRIAHALHRLAFEGQILHTDAWPGVFDEWTLASIRAVQEAAERILSGEDIRYLPAEASTSTPPERFS
jgi:hypothetical protein